MLSILIPTYNFNIVSLVKELHQQATNCNIDFEILAYDDASQSDHNIDNATINELKNTLFKELHINIGRSSIRNLLAKDAQYENLLFVDSGTFPKNNDFIKKYLSTKNQKVINGGMTHLKNKPKKPYRLRWVYTKKREGKALCSSNFLIKKNVIIKFPFDESIKKYGYEDILFFNTLINNNIKVYSFKNQVYHRADDDANTFIKKSKEAIKNLMDLHKNNKVEKKWSKILQYYSKLETLKLTRHTANLFKRFQYLLLKNFNSSYPSLLFYDFYRLGYYCLIKTKR